MKEVYYLLKRNILLYIRDYVSVFFSILSMLIVLALMVIFLGNMNSENVVEALEQHGGMQGSPEAEAQFAYMIEMAVRESFGNMDSEKMEDMLEEYGEELEGFATDEEKLACLIEMSIRTSLGDMDSGEMEEMLGQLGGGARDTAADKKNADYLIRMWTLAGILEVNAITIALTVMGTMVQDETKNRLASFYMAPVKRIKIALGYILSSWIVGTVMCVLTLILGEIYMALCGNPLLSAPDWLALLGMIVLNVFVYASLAYLLALFIHSESAWSSILTIIGTLVGFVGAIYLPMSMLPEGVGKVLKCLPVLHGAAMMRMVCTKDAVKRTFAGLPESAGDTFREQMGVSIFMGGREISLQEQILFLGICAIIAIIVSAWISKGRKLRDR